MAAERELEQALRERDKAEADLRGYVEAASALDPALFKRGLDARQNRLEVARGNVQAASARTTRLPVAGSLIQLWDTFTPAERREMEERRVRRRLRRLLHPFESIDAFLDLHRAVDGVHDRIDVPRRNVLFEPGSRDRDAVDHKGTARAHPR